MQQGNHVDLEKDNITGINHEGAHANTPVRVLTASSIIGESVENVNGDDLGAVKDVMLNIQDGTIEYVILQSGGFLGIGEKLFAIPFRELHLNADKKCFVLDRTKEYIKNSPGFDLGHWPETNSRYEEINNYWASNFVNAPVASANPANTIVGPDAVHPSFL